MIETSVEVPTRHATKYVASLCKHWSHRLPVEQVGEGAIVRFEDAIAALTPTSDSLVITVLANQRSDADRIQSFVQTHVDRFAFQEAPLNFSWVHPATDLHAL